MVIVMKRRMLAFCILFVGLLTTVPILTATSIEKEGYFPKAPFGGTLSTAITSMYVENYMDAEAESLPPQPSNSTWEDEAFYNLMDAWHRSINSTSYTIEEFQRTKYYAYRNAIAWVYEHYEDRDLTDMDIYHMINDTGIDLDYMSVMYGISRGHTQQFNLWQNFDTNILTTGNIQIKYKSGYNDIETKLIEAMNGIYYVPWYSLAPGTKVSFVVMHKSVLALIGPQYSGSTQNANLKLLRLDEPAIIYTGSIYNFRAHITTVEAGVYTIENTGPHAGYLAGEAIIPLNDAQLPYYEMGIVLDYSSDYGNTKEWYDWYTPGTSTIVDANVDDYLTVLNNEIGLLVNTLVDVINTARVRWNDLRNAGYSSSSELPSHPSYLKLWVPEDHLTYTVQEQYALAMGMVSAIGKSMTPDTYLQVQNTTSWKYPVYSNTTRIRMNVYAPDSSTILDNVSCYVWVPEGYMVIHRGNNTVDKRVYLITENNEFYSLYTDPLQESQYVIEALEINVSGESVNQTNLTAVYLTYSDADGNSSAGGAGTTTEGTGESVIEQYLHISEWSWKEYVTVAVVGLLALYGLISLLSGRKGRRRRW